MRYFGNRRPRGFHHTFIYVDEHKGWRSRETEADTVQEDSDRRKDKRLRPFASAAHRHPAAWSRSIGTAAVLALLLVAVALLLLSLGHL